MSQECTNCGALNRPNYRFCSSCGAPLAPIAPTTAPVDTTSVDASAPPGDNAQLEQSPSSATYVVRRWESESASEEMQSDTTPAETPTAARPAQAPDTARQPATSYQPYMPGAAGRREGAAYAPYSVDAASQLEKPRSERSWLIPAVVVAAVITFGLIGTGAYLMLGNRFAGTQQSKCAPVSADASEEEQVKQVVSLSNEEQIKGWRNLDTDVLRCRRTGQVLQENIGIVEELKVKGMYAVPANRRFEILDVQVTGDTAIVKTIEEWTVTFYGQDGTKVQSKGPDTLKETYYLRKIDGNWLIERLDFQEQPSPGS